MANFPNKPKRQPRPSVLGKDLVPRLGIDPGSTSTGIDVIVGPVLLEAVAVLNPEITAERHAPGADPAVGYGAAVEAEVRRLAAKYADVARAWYGPGVVPADVDPWLLGGEKINPARRPCNDDEAEHFDDIEVAEGSTFAANAVANRLLGAFHGRIIWVIPFHADTRWESRFEHGTGNPFDFYPAALLATAIPEGNSGRTYPDRYFDRAQFRQSRVKDALAAWSIANDAAQDYEAKCIAKHGRLLPPHLAPDAVWAACPPPVGGRCGTPAVRRFDLGAQEDPTEVRYQYAYARLTSLVRGDTQNPHEVARDLMVVAQYKGVAVEEIVTGWSRWATRGIDRDQPDISQPEVDTVRFVRKVAETTQRLVA